MVTMLFDARPYIGLVCAIEPELELEDMQWLLREVLFETLAVGVVDHPNPSTCGPSLTGNIRSVLCPWVWATLHPIRYFDLRHELDIELTKETIIVRGEM